MLRVRSERDDEGEGDEREEDESERGVRVERALAGCLGALLLSPARTQARVRRRPQAHLLRDIQVPGEPPRLSSLQG